MSLFDIWWKIVVFFVYVATIIACIVIVIAFDISSSIEDD